MADLGEGRGKQDLFTRQSPQKLEVLHDNALIESAVSSNRIEGVEADQARIATIVFGKGQLRDRNEEEIRGYRNALELIHEGKREGTNLRPKAVVLGVTIQQGAPVEVAAERRFQRRVHDHHCKV